MLLCPHRQWLPALEDGSGHGGWEAAVREAQAAFKQVNHRGREVDRRRLTHNRKEGR